MWGRAPKEGLSAQDSVSRKAKERAGKVDRGTRWVLADNAMSSLNRALFDMQRAPQGDQDAVLEVWLQARTLLGVCEALRESEILGS